MCRRSSTVCVVIAANLFYMDNWFLLVLQQVWRIMRLVHCLQRICYNWSFFVVRHSLCVRALLQILNKPTTTTTSTEHAPTTTTTTMFLLLLVCLSICFAVQRGHSIIIETVYTICAASHCVALCFVHSSTCCQAHAVGTMCIECCAPLCVCVWIFHHLCEKNSAALCMEPAALGRVQGESKESVCNDCTAVVTY